MRILILVYLCYRLYEQSAQKYGERCANIDAFFSSVRSLYLIHFLSVFFQFRASKVLRSYVLSTVRTVPTVRFSADTLF
ncbi:Uncharacterised protein [Chlamydia trachomatis]|nr:Uncharacterised protein [Chlamydia trachomatis]